MNIVKKYNKIKIYISKSKYLGKYIRNTLILIIIFGIFILIDLLTKYLVFDSVVASKGHASKFVADWKIIAWRSQAHYGTTLLDLIQVSLPRWARLLIGYSLAALFIFCTIFSSRKFIAFAFSMTLAGIVGNTFDNVYFDYVRNIMYVPWISGGNLGTFNFADMWIIIGTFLAGVSLIIFVIHERKKEKNAKLQKNNLEPELLTFIKQKQLSLIQKRQQKKDIEPKNIKLEKSDNLKNKNK